MKQTNTLVIGASIAGLASAACLKKRGIDYTVIEKESRIATPWHNHYERLHLHTSKGLSHLPFKEFGKRIPRYPSRNQVIEYLEEYQNAFDICPLFNCEAGSVKKESDGWVTETSNGRFRSKYLVIATGAYSKPKAFAFNGAETFPGKILHSCHYKSGRVFRGQKVLVIGFGNSACEIAIDLYEQGAIPVMSVRSPVNIIPRDILGVPVLHWGRFFSKLPPRAADTIISPLLRIIFGDFAKLGLKKMPYGVFEQIQQDKTIPLLDIGTVQLIREGHILIYDDIDYVEGNAVHFKGGRQSDFDNIIAAVGYYPGFPEFLHVDKERMDDLKLKTSMQQYFGVDGLYACGFWIGPTGVIREISVNAQEIANDIAQREGLPVVQER